MRSILFKPFRFNPIRTSIRSISTTKPTYSIFGKLTQTDSSENDLDLIKNQKQSSTTETDSEPSIDSITPQNDEKLIEYHKQQSLKKQIKKEDYLNPIKLEMFNKVVKQYGFFKNDQIVDHDGKLFKFHLNPEEIELCEPSIYLTSFRIKSSTKKATVVNRFVRGFNLKTAINQLHFNPKKMSIELEKLLKKGLEEGEKMGVNTDELYISNLWCGSDGYTRKRLQAKGRGRAGLVQHKYVHLKCILKTNQTKLRQQYERELKLKVAKPKRGVLNDEPLNFKVRPWYKW
ncbi:unnamed protein product [Candida verbasci]|uniref:Ribosomal protein L22 n=1 Tax=Candida verbasci TaxID=1227364 RepID=A0A9W4U0Z3_9ASCO|nr:unnamed protein product [Candida verbasci]